MTARVELGSITQPIKLTGSVEGFVRTAIASEEEGVVSEILALEGDYVTTGTALLRMRPEPFQLRLAQARAQADADRQRYLELANGTRAEDLEIARANHEEGKTNAEIAKADFERYEQLLRDGNTSQSEYDRVRRAYVTAQANERVLKARLDIAERGSRAEVVAAAKAQAEASEALAGLAADSLERSTVRAPFAGAITNKYISLGSFLDRGTRLYDFEYMDHLKVAVEVPERYFSLIEVGDTFQVAIDAFPNEPFTARVHQKVPRADRQNRAFQIFLEMPNPGRRVASGMLARIELDAPSADEKSVLVLRDALVPQGPALFVFKAVRTEGGVVAEMLPVTTGRFFGQSVEVFGPLKAGDEVVIRGNERLRPGQPLLTNQFVTDALNSADRVDPTGFFDESNRVE
ncbi:MAG: efflux RND transporter periplasmic adaptor subunit [Candidatus Sumerlaeia bacterium]|nr:efflux RND transporter periplasmic adaptor subunit [Candidatus Sumerlaeia bacterium]